MEKEKEIDKKCRGRMMGGGEKFPPALLHLRQKKKKNVWERV